MIHRIKIRESFADAVYRGDKSFEVRKNDRGYQAGDYVRFTVLYDSDGLDMISHPLHERIYVITYVLSGRGIEDGYVVFGIKEICNDIEESSSPKLMQDSEGLWATCNSCGEKLWELFGQTVQLDHDKYPKFCPRCGKKIKMSCEDEERK